MSALPGRVVEFVTTFLQSHKPSRQEASLRKSNKLDALSAKRAR